MWAATTGDGSAQWPETLQGWNVTNLMVRSIERIPEYEYME